MGEHKYNPTAIAAKNGELPPKKQIEVVGEKLADYALVHKCLRLQAAIEREISEELRWWIILSGKR